MALFREKVLRNQNDILARLEAIGPVEVSDGAPVRSLDTNGNGIWDDNGLWNSRNATTAPAPRPLPSVDAATSLRTRLDRIGENKCKFDPCITSMRHDGVNSVERFGVACKGNGGDLLLTTRDGSYVENATLDTFIEHFANARASDAAPRARCMGASVTSGRACEAWDVEVERCLARP